RVLSYSGDATARPVHEMTSASPMATFSAHTASPPPPSRTPADLRDSSRHASIAPRTTSARGPLAWAAPRTRTHRSIPAPPTPAGPSRLPSTAPSPAPACAPDRPSPDPHALAQLSTPPAPRAPRPPHSF